ncbi:MAG: class I SAM-dependent methyltransferase [Thermoanaerobaculales bacterium]
MIGTNPTRWRPLGRALRDYHRGATSAELIVHSDLWEAEATPVMEFYRPENQELPELELRALSLCRDRTLDLGAGAGRHALELQRRGHTVTALDVAAEAVEVMRDRGVKDARCGDLETVRDEKFDTILLLMHGIGLVGDLAGLARFLEDAAEILTGDGRIVCDSADLGVVMGPKQMEILNRSGAGESYPGEVEFQLTFDGLVGDPYPWLFVDPRTLARFAEEAGLRCQVVTRGARGAYLACIEQKDRRG